MNCWSGRIIERRKSSPSIAAALDMLAQRLLDDETLDQEQVFAIFEAADGGMPRHGFSVEPGDRPAPVPEPALLGGLRAESGDTTATETSPVTTD